MAKQSFTTGQVLTAAQVNSLQANDFNQTVSPKTASYVLVASDKGTRIEFNTSGSVTCTVNTGLFDAGDTVYIQNRGAGVVTITAGTATVNTSASLAVNQWEGGVLYFISASASVWYEYASTANGDITGVTAGTGISGGGTSGDVTITNTMATAIDAKGDLVAGTADNTFARLAVGNNGETLVADSSATTGLRWQGLLASGRNFVTNGSADIWQRGTSFTIGTNRSYTADRWECLRGALVAGLTVSRQTVSDSTNLPFVQYSIRLQRDSGNTSTQSLNITQNLETIDSIPLAGRTVTLSFYARVGANYSGSGASVSAIVVQGTGTDQNLWNGYTGQSTAFQSSITPTTTWTRYSVTGSIASTSTQVGFYLSSNPTGTAGANDWIEYTGLQLEVGSVATPFRRAGGNIAGELAACQRYYFRYTADAGIRVMGTGQCFSSTAAATAFKFPVTMRIRPTALEQSGTASHYGVLNNNGTTLALSAVPTYDAGTTSEIGWTGHTVSTGLAAGNATIFVSNNTASAYLGWSAEL